MEHILKEIREHFASHSFGMRPLESLPSKFMGYSIRKEEYYGVAISFDSELEVAEESTSIKFETKNYVINGDIHKFLVLICFDEEFRIEFAKFCTQFIVPGEDGFNRKNLMKDPFKWWDHWVNLLGDRKSNKKSYDVLAELIILDQCFCKDHATIWASTHAGSHDIELSEESIEVKSTVKKEETSITISSQFQLDSEKKLSLAFIRMEESACGISINDKVKELIEHGYDASKIEGQLYQKGLSSGNRMRDLKYNILETRVFNIDDDFPKITKDSFKHGIFPKNITKITYTIDLEGLEYRTKI